MWRFVLDPFRALWDNFVALIRQFRDSQWWVRTIAFVATLVLAHLVPAGLVVCSLVALGYGHGHPLARVAWDLGMLVLLIELLSITTAPLIVLSVLVLNDLVSDTAIRTRMYAYGAQSIT